MLQKIEECIFQRPGGRFCVEISVSNRNRKASFVTIEEARQWRDEIKSTRPQRVYISKAKPPRSYRPTTPEDRERRRANKALLESSPRRTMEIDGREYTLVELPDGPKVREIFNEGSLTKRISRQMAELT